MLCSSIPYGWGEGIVVQAVFGDDQGRPSLGTLHTAAWVVSPNFPWQAVGLVLMDDEHLSRLAASLRSELQAIGFAGLTDERRSIRVPVYFTPSEKAKLDAVCAGVGISKFIRSLLLRLRPPTPRPIVPQVNREVYIELSRLGRNMNQQTRVLHEALQQIPTSQALERLEASIVPAYLAQLEALTLLLHQVRQALVPLNPDEDADAD